MLSRIKPKVTLIFKVKRRFVRKSRQNIAGLISFLYKMKLVCMVSIDAHRSMGLCHELKTKKGRMRGLFPHHLSRETGWSRAI